MSQKMDGTKHGRLTRERLALRVEVLKQVKRSPGLGMILVGHDLASKSYVAAKERACKELGIATFQINLEEEVSQEELLTAIDKLNKDENIDGILIQLPLPSHLNSLEALNYVRSDKDVDGLTDVNLGALMQERPRFIPCTPKGILRLLDLYKVQIEGKNVVVVGRSLLVGATLSNLLWQKSNGNATVTICHSKTKDLAWHTKRADILIVAAGQRGLINGEMIQKNAIVVDVGIHKIKDHSGGESYIIEGDVDFPSASEKASLITPVPGGVGPMTIAMLLENVVMACEQRWLL